MGAARLGKARERSEGRRRSRLGIALAVASN